MMMREMVERVARAIFEVNNPDCEWDYCASIAEHPLHIQAMDSARAAIAAMREPTPRMCKSGEEEIEKGYRDGATIWNAMLDAAFK